ncbi:hypothetical protein EOD39_16316 [Acipenser ruthenus]|uniref:Uncharacterized protein n=1 Tax=Acipenser ruthenus TaxID=7906 RepID=A0A444V683_ACIRT|nr:hypothetical protein EOD39_16316 [Acipenser ruthenus]
MINTVWGCLHDTTQGCLHDTARGCLHVTAQGCLHDCTTAGTAKLGEASLDVVSTSADSSIVASRSSAMPAPAEGVSLGAVSKSAARTAPAEGVSLGAVR